MLILFAWFCVGVDLGGILTCFDVISMLALMFCFEGLSWGLFWHHSPVDREEVAMYGRRALVGPQWCRVSFHGERRERG